MSDIPANRRTMHAARAIAIAIACMLAMMSFATLPACTAASRDETPPATAQVSASEAQGAGLSSPSSSESAATADAKADIANAFPSWNAESASLAALVSFVTAATDKSSPGYIEPAGRVAVFDLDGTLISEKDPVYMDYSLMFHRVLDDPSHQVDPATVEACQAMRAHADRGVVEGNIGEGKNAILVKAFTGMTQEEFSAYVNGFLDTCDVRGFSGMKYGQSAYKPMVEVMDYLRANDFELFIVTACEREVARVFAESRLGVDPDHVIGSDWEMDAVGQGGEAVADNSFGQGDKLVIGDEKTSSCSNANKVVFIQREIGKQPVLAFGNSSGDFPMLNYAQSGSGRPGMGFLVIADDDEREYGNEESAAQMRDEAARAGWTGVSMRDDWATIYGEGVSKTHLPADEALADAA